MRSLTLPKDLSLFFSNQYSSTSTTPSTTCCCLTKHKHAAPVDHGGVVVPWCWRRPRRESPAQVTTAAVKHSGRALGTQSHCADLEKKQLLEVILLFLSVSLVLDS